MARSWLANYDRMLQDFDSEKYPVRKYGGKAGDGDWLPNQPAKLATSDPKGVSVGTVNYQEQPYQGVSTAQQKQLDELAKTDKPWRKTIRNFDATKHIPYGGAEGKILGTAANMAFAPIKSLNNLTDPEHSYTGNPYNNMLDYGVDAATVAPLATGAVGKVNNFVEGLVTHPSTGGLPMMTDVTPIGGVQRNYKDILLARKQFAPTIKEETINGETFGNAKFDIFGQRQNYLKSKDDWNQILNQTKGNLKSLAFQPDKVDAAYKNAIDANNTFVRGVSTNWEHIQKSDPEAFKSITQTLENAGIDWRNNPDRAATYMATHVPPQTGYGRAGLNPDEHGLYTSNSEGTAEGYTYGNGYIVRGKVPTKFEGTDRQDWLRQNHIPIIEQHERVGPHFDPVDNFRYSVVHNHNTDFVHPINRPLADDFIDKVNEKSKELYSKLGNGYDPLLRDKPDANGNYTAPGPYSPRPDGTRPTSREVNDISLELGDYKETLYDDYKNRIQKPDPVDVTGKVLKAEEMANGYAHYIHVGEPGSKVLEPVDIKQITPEIWKSRSRGHSGEPTQGLSKREFGGSMKNTNEIPTKNYMPPLPELNKDWVRQTQNMPEPQYMQSGDKSKQQAQEMPWRDKIRSGIDYTSQKLHGQGPTGDLLGTAWDAISNPAQIAVDVSDPKQPLSDRIVKSLAFESPLMRGESKVIEEPQYGSWAPRSNGPTPLRPEMTPTLTGSLEKEIPLTKEQQILQSHGLDPYKKRIPDKETHISISNNSGGWDPTMDNPWSSKNIDKVIKPQANMFVTKNPLGKGEAFEQNYSQELFPGISTSPNENITMPKGNQTYNPDFFPYEPDGPLRHYNIQDKIMKRSSNFPEQYTDFGPKTPMQIIYEGRQEMPDRYIPTKRQQNKFGGKMPNGGTIQFTDEKTTPASEDTKRVALTSAQQEEQDKQQQIQAIQQRQSYIQDKNKVDEQARNMPWRDKVRSGMNYLQQKVGSMGPAGDLASIPLSFATGMVNNAVDLSEPQKYYQGKSFGEGTMALGMGIAGLMPEFSEEGAAEKGIANKSKINWGKWNSEIPNNPQLMSEYKTIEQTSKKAGTWMKNPDGSAFQGSPEQFIQQNSQNFKNAFGNTKFKDASGSPLILHHGTMNDFSSFVPPKFTGNSNSGYEGEYSFFTPHKSLAEDYKGDAMSNFGNYNKKSNNVKSVYINSENPLIDSRTEFPEDLIPEKERVGHDAIVASLNPNEFSEVAVPYGNNVKSATGNNGMFNMKSRNIYKSLVPITGVGIGAAALSQDNKQYGGWLKKY